MAERNETLELRFRIFDGTDIGHGTYTSSVTTVALKQRLLSVWPQGLILPTLCVSLSLCEYFGLHGN